MDDLACASCLLQGERRTAITIYDSRALCRTHFIVVAANQTQRANQDVMRDVDAALSRRWSG